MLIFNFINPIKERLQSMSQRNYSTIVFDLGNVLIPFNHQLWIDNYNKIELGLGDNYALNIKKIIMFIEIMKAGKFQMMNLFLKI